MPSNILFTTLTILTTVTSFTLATSLSYIPRQSSTKITIDLNKTYQSIDGFGVSETFQRANQIHNLSEPLQKYCLDLLFNRTSGAGFSILRNGIGSSVDSRSDWMVSIQPQSPGGPTSTPKYIWDNNDNSQVWLSTSAVKTYNLSTIYADAWSAPGYMKTNNNDANGGTLCGVSGSSCSSGDWKQAYANYLVQYLTYYKQIGVKITHVGFLNEPDLTTSYASMRSNGQQAADFIKVLRPAMDKAGYVDVRIACCDAEGWSSQSGFMSGLASVDSMLGVVTAHSYTSQPTSPINTKHPVWQSENADLQGPWSTSFYTSYSTGEGLVWAQKIHDALTKGNAAAYLYWIGIQGGATNSKLVRIADDKRSVITSKRFWVFAGWSRYVRPGAVRVGASVSGQGSGMDLGRVSAYVNKREEGGSVVVQIINAGANGGRVGVGIGSSGFVVSSAKAWVTDNTRECASLSGVSVGTDGVTVEVPARSMVSVVLEGKSLV